MNIVKRINSFTDDYKKNDDDLSTLREMKRNWALQKDEIEQTINGFNAFVDESIPNNDNTLKEIDKAVMRQHVEIEKIKDQLKTLKAPVVASEDHTMETVDPRNNIYQRREQKLSKTKDAEILICMDSNRKYIDFRKLWTLKGSRWKPCGNIRELNNFIDSTDIHSMKYILINVGINDIDTRSGQEVYESLRETVDKLKTKYTGISIILSELTPRGDHRDAEGVKCNVLINQLAENDDQITIAHHYNLRDEEHTMFEDTKHVSSHAIARFAANLKIALRTAHGIIRPNRRSVDRHQGNYNNYHDKGSNHHSYPDANQSNLTYNDRIGNIDYGTNHDVTYDWPNYGGRSPPNYNYSKVSFDAGNNYDPGKWFRNANYNIASLV